MSSSHAERPACVTCIRNEGYAVSLAIGKIYEVIPEPESEAHGMIRIVDETGEDYLYPAAWFRVVDEPGAVAPRDE